MANQTLLSPVTIRHACVSVWYLTYIFNNIMQVVHCIYLKKVYFCTACSGKFTTRVHKTRAATKFVLVNFDRGTYRHARMNMSGKCVLFPFQMDCLCGHLYWSLHLEILFVYSVCGPGNCFLNTKISMAGTPRRFRRLRHSWLVTDYGDHCSCQSFVYHYCHTSIWKHFGICILQLFCIFCMHHFALLQRLLFLC